MRKHKLIVLLGGIAAVMVAMGIGRFAFTPILPMMMERHLFSAAGAGYLASSNYLGYLIGAFVLTLVQVKSRSVLLFAGLIVSTATIWGMGEFHSLEAWLLLRFLSGLASAVVFIIASSIVMDRLSALQAGIFYGGVGTGVLAMHIPQGCGCGPVQEQAFSKRSKIWFGSKRRLKRKQNSSK